MTQEAYDMIVNQKTKKGPVLQTAVIASILGTITDKQSNSYVPSFDAN